MVGGKGSGNFDSGFREAKNSRFDYCTLRRFREGHPSQIRAREIWHNCTVRLSPSADLAVAVKRRNFQSQGDTRFAKG